MHLALRHINHIVQFKGAWKESGFIVSSSREQQDASHTCPR